MPSLRDRLAGHAQVRLTSDAASERAVMARSLAYLFAAGSMLAFASLALTDSPTGALQPTALKAACAGAALLLTTCLLAVSGPLRLWAFHLVLACGSALVSVAISFSGGVTSTYVMFYVWVTLYAAYFFTRGQAALQVGLVGIAYSLVLFAENGGELPQARWLITLGTLFVAGALIVMLKERLGRLISRLADAARTDVLTGLLNRRGFQELFDLELERAKRSGRSLGVLVGDIDHFKELNDRFGHQRGDMALERLSEVLVAGKRRIDTAARIGGEEFALILPDAQAHDAYIVAERLRRAVRQAFESWPGSVTICFGVASYPKHGGSPAALLQAADQALYAAKELGRDRSVIHNAEIAGALAGAASRRQAQREGYLSTVLALAEALDQRDSGTALHSETVGRYAELTARELGLDEKAVDRVRIGGILHDVGKIGLPDSILRKPGPLSAEDWREMRKHPEIAARILDSATVEDIRGWVLAHHERPDGRGYPQGLSADAIPLEAKILAVADAYEAMTSDRIYRRALTADEARAELERSAGTQFDEQVVAAFLRVLEGPERGSLPAQDAGRDRSATSSR